MQITDINAMEKEHLTVALEKHLASLKRSLTTATPRFKELINQDIADVTKLQTDVAASKTSK